MTVSIGVNVDLPIRQLLLALTVQSVDEHVSDRSTMSALRGKSDGIEKD